MQTMRTIKVSKYGDASVLKVRIDHVLPLSEAEKAHRLLENRQSIGKIVLTA